MALTAWVRISHLGMALGLMHVAPAQAGVIDAGDTHACAIDKEGAVWCWGSDRYGQLGNGGADESSVSPVPIPSTAFAGRKVVAVSTGELHSCALDEQGEAWCWGENTYGQLGIANNVDQFAPQKVSTDNVPSKRFVSIAAGKSHTCAIDADGGGFCWGGEQDGVLGDNGMGTNDSIPTPVAMPAGIDLIAISAGFDFTCALSTSQAWCWGYNLFGKLGIGSTSPDLSPSPVAVVLPLGVQFRSITLGQNHACAIDMSGKVWCWGYGSYGQIGDLNTIDRYVPTAIHDNALPPGTTFAEISAGLFHTCARDVYGKAWCWGGDHDGQLGNGEPRVKISAPTEVLPSAVPGNLEAIAAGRGFNCAINIHGAVSCWGEGTYGQLGAGSSGSVTQPQLVELPNAIQVEAGLNHTCALNAQGQA